MPHFQHTLEVNAPSTAVFEILDDTSRTPQWLSRCTQIDTLSEGPNTVGTKLRYHYKDAGRTGVMDGRVTVYEPGRHIAMSYADKQMEVTVDFVTAPGATEGTTRLTHTVDIAPKGVAKAFTFMINRTLPKQTTEAMGKLRALAES